MDLSSPISHVARVVYTTAQLRGMEQIMAQYNRGNMVFTAKADNEECARFVKDTREPCFLLHEEYHSRFRKANAESVITTQDTVYLILSSRMTGYVFINNRVQSTFLLTLEFQVRDDNWQIVQSYPGMPRQSASA